MIVRQRLALQVVSCLVSGIFMFPYNHVLDTFDGKTNHSSTIVDCTVNDTDSFFSSCIFTFTFYYLLPLAIIGLSYSRVLVHVRRTSVTIAKRLVSDMSCFVVAKIIRSIMVGLISISGSPSFLFCRIDFDKAIYSLVNYDFSSFSRVSLDNRSSSEDVVFNGCYSV